MRSENQVEELISKLYRSTRDVRLEHFRQWALEQLRGLISFDSAIWLSGHLSTRSFHTHTLIDLPDDYPQQLLSTLPLNPISKQLFAQPDAPVDMADVICDREFFESQIYHQLFKPNRIARILSAINIDSRSGVFTLLSLYRRDHDKSFNADEKRLHQRLLYHLFQSASHACLINLDAHANARSANVYAAICDQHGIYHEVEPGFLDLVENTFADHDTQQLPFALLEAPGEWCDAGLHISCRRLGELRHVLIRKQHKTDLLTSRERQVVRAVSRGLSFKQAGRELELAPSTVANHLYRVYQKLGISSRGELAQLLMTTPIS